MNTQFAKLIAAFTLITPLVFLQCNDHDDTAGIGQLTLEITDSPVDDPNVQSVFVTVAEVRVDGKAWDGFSGKTTFDLLALQDGKVRGLGSGDVESGVHGNIALVLDTQSDADGGAPAAYVVTVDGSRQEIVFDGSAEQVIQIEDSNFDIEEDMTTTAVIDFDLRKSIVSTGAGASETYAFVNAGQLQNAVRIVNKGLAGHVAGNCTTDTSAQMVVVYAYHNGEFSNSEMQPDPVSGVRFAHAVTSASVDAKGDYKLSFLESGDYEVVFVGYNENTEGEFEIVGLLSLDSLLGNGPQEITVTANTTATLNVAVTGILP